MWTIRDAKGNQRGRFDIETDAWMEYERLAELAGCMAPFSVVEIQAIKGWKVPAAKRTGSQA